MPLLTNFVAVSPDGQKVQLQPTDPVRGGLVQTEVQIRAWEEEVMCLPARKRRLWRARVLTLLGELAAVRYTEEPLMVLGYESHFVMKLSLQSRAALKVGEEWCPLIPDTHPMPVRFCFEALAGVSGSRNEAESAFLELTTHSGRHTRKKTIAVPTHAGEAVRG